VGRGGNVARERPEIEQETFFFSGHAVCKNHSLRLRADDGISPVIFLRHFGKAGQRSHQRGLACGDALMMESDQELA
jgi:hypothetical protein